jgi:hypothetical protein
MKALIEILADVVSLVTFQQPSRQAHDEFRRHPMPGTTANMMGPTASHGDRV